MQECTRTILFLIWLVAAVGTMALLFIGLMPETMFYSFWIVLGATAVIFIGFAAAMGEDDDARNDADALLSYAHSGQFDRSVLHEDGRSEVDEITRIGA
jgi:hypothetical protein